MGKRQPKPKLPWHRRIIRDMDAITSDSRRGTRRAIHAAEEILSTSCPKDHGEVRASFNRMIATLGGDKSRRFNRHHRQLFNWVRGDLLQKEDEAAKTNMSKPGADPTSTLVTEDTAAGGESSERDRSYALPG